MPPTMTVWPTVAGGSPSPAPRPWSGEYVRAGEGGGRTSAEPEQRGGERRQGGADAADGVHDVT
jgi:hypothetical protein